MLTRTSKLSSGLSRCLGSQEGSQRLRDCRARLEDSGFQAGLLSTIKMIMVQPKSNSLLRLCGGRGQI